jgi:hypothetical protein
MEGGSLSPNRETRPTLGAGGDAGDALWDGQSRLNLVIFIDKGKRGPVGGDLFQPYLATSLLSCFQCGRQGHALRHNGETALPPCYTTSWDAIEKGPREALFSCFKTVPSTGHLLRCY